MNGLICHEKQKNVWNQNIIFFHTIGEYCEWAKMQENAIQIAHNLKGQDGHFIVSWLLQNLLPNESTGTTCCSNKVSVYTIQQHFVDCC